MRRGKGMIALIAAGAGLAVAAIPAAAELHSVTVVLATGARIQTTVDVPPGTPVSQVSIPGVSGPIKQVIDNGPISAPAPSATPVVPVPTVPGVASPTPDGNGSPGAPNRTEGGANGAVDQGTGSTGVGVGVGNRTTHAGRIQGKKIAKGNKGKGNVNDAVGELKKIARKKAGKKEPGRALDGAPTLDNP